MKEDKSKRNKKVTISENAIQTAQAEVNQPIVAAEPALDARAAQLLSLLASVGESNQRSLAAKLGCSLGKLNTALKQLRSLGLVEPLSSKTTSRKAGPSRLLTQEGYAFCSRHRPARAILLAADSGLRVGHSRGETPKGLLPVEGEPLVERLIRQLREVGIPEIIIVVGYRKEEFEYLTEKPGVRLVYNERYHEGGTLYALSKVGAALAEAYVLPTDLWFRDNPFSGVGLRSWYALEAEETPDGLYRPRRDLSLAAAGVDEDLAHGPLGLAYFTKETAEALRLRLEKLARHPRRRRPLYWEDACLQAPALKLDCRLFTKEEVVSVTTANTYLQLLGRFNHKQEELMGWAAEKLGVDPDELIWEEPVKRGMTNRTLSFLYGGERYLQRIPGEGSEKLVKRLEEAEVYKVLPQWEFAEHVLAFDPCDGRKLTRFLPNTHLCDPHNEEDLKRAMKTLQSLHAAKLEVPHRFDYFAKLEEYRSYCTGEPSPFKRNEEVYRDILRLRTWLDSLPQQEVLCHMDFVPDNLLFDNDSGRCTVIDWEYAGMQHPLSELAMFSVYAGYKREEIDHLIDLYFAAAENPRPCEPWERLRTYAYVACSGYLWNVWCQLKAMEGVEFGDYWRQQYTYGRDYSRLVLEALPALEQTRTENAVVLAAGTSARFVPHSLLRPKALAKIHGECLLDRQLRQLEEAGVKNITLITGYMPEAFAAYAERPGVELVHNPYALTRNNLSSLACAVSRLGNTYICSIDNYFPGQVFAPYDARPYYAAVYAEGETAEWCLGTDEEGWIREVTIGGADSPVMLGQVRFDEAFSKIFRELVLEAAGKPECYDWLWEELYRRHLHALRLTAKLHDASAILEFDSVEEALAYDPDFWKENPCEPFEALCQGLGCRPEDCRDFRPLRKPGEAVAYGFTFRLGEDSYEVLVEENQPWQLRRLNDLLQ